MSNIVTGNRYADPPRPMLVRLINLLGTVLPVGPFARRLNVDNLVRNARRRSGLTDFGDEWFTEPLAVLVDAINANARLTPMGRLIQRTRLVGALENRLRARQLFRQNPEILDQELGKVIVIAGLQRTGTTMLHRLLASDPAARSLLSWEALNPAPFPGDQDNRHRHAEARKAQKALAWLAPQFFAIHPVEWDAPEEDVLLLDLSFMSQAPEATMTVPAYATWLESADHRPAYEYLRDLMKLLQWQRPGTHWVLKTPHHMEYLDTLLDVFPDATIIQTHRDPRRTMGSFCSMVAHGQGVFSNHVDPVAVGRHWTRKVRIMLENTIAARQARADRHVVDVLYDDLMTDPITQIQRIYDTAGIELADAALQSMNAARQANRQHKYGRHVYDLADFGLSIEQIDRDFDFYRQRHGIPVEVQS